jgi:hypothetical protein
MQRLSIRKAERLSSYLSWLALFFKNSPEFTKFFGKMFVIKLPNLFVVNKEHASYNSTHSQTFLCLYLLSSWAAHLLDVHCFKNPKIMILQQDCILVMFLLADHITNP